MTVSLLHSYTVLGPDDPTHEVSKNRWNAQHLLTMVTSSFLGRLSAGTGAAEELTGTQATSLLDTFTTSLKGLAPASGGGTTNFLRADGTWAAPPGGGGGLTIGTSTITGGTSGNFEYNNAGVLGERTPTQVTATLDQFTTTLKGVVPGSGGGTTNFLRADGSWAAPAGGGGGTPGGSDTQVQFNDAGTFGGNAGFTFNKTSGLITMGTGTTTQAILKFQNQGSGIGGIYAAGVTPSSANYTFAISQDNSVHYFQATNQLNFQIASTSYLNVAANRVFLPSTADLEFGPDVALMRDGAAGVLAQRNGTNAQTFRVYNTFTDASNYERAVLDWTTQANQLNIGTQAAGTGTLRGLTLSLGGAITSPFIVLTPSGQMILNTANTNLFAFRNGNTDAFRIDCTRGATTADLLFSTDNVSDIGAAGASRPRRLYLSDYARIGGTTVTASTPVLDLSQTWNAAGVAFTGIRSNITRTASAAGSLAMDLQAGGLSIFQVYGDGTGFGINSGAGNGPGAVGPAIQFIGGVIWEFNHLGGGGGTSALQWAMNSPDIAVGGSLAIGATFATRDAYIFRDAANTLAQRNGVNANSFRVYNTFTDASNYERAVIDWNSNILTMGVQAAGTGNAARLVIFNGNAFRFITALSNTAQIGNNAANNDSSLTIGEINLGFASGDNNLTRAAAKVIRFGDGTGANANGWIQWGGQARVTSDFSVTSSAVLVNVTGLSVNVQAGRTYAFETELYITDAAAGGVQAAIAGTATATAIQYTGYTIADNAIKGKTNATALATAVGSTVTTETSGIVVRITGTITVNAAGTLTVQMAQNTSNGTATVAKRGSYLIVQDMP